MYKISYSAEIKFSIYQTKNTGAKLEIIHPGTRRQGRLRKTTGSALFLVLLLNWVHAEP